MPLATLGARAKFTLNTEDLSGDGNNIKLNMTQNEIDATVFNDTGWMNKIVGMSQFALDFAGFYDEAADMEDEEIFAMFGAPPDPTPFTYHPINSTSGHIVYSGDVFAQKYDINSVPAGPVVFSATFSGTGELERATV